MVPATVPAGPARGWLLAAFALAGCGPSPAPPAPAPADRPADSRALDSTRVAPDSAPQPVAPPAQAFQLGWMPLVSTNVPAFLAAHPDWDGRGVLIAILDGGVDPVPGLARLPNGSDKILDMRDFSGEGRVALKPLELAGDRFQIDGRILRGAGRIRVLNAGGPVYGGLLRELPLGEPPAADLNGNGAVGDSLPVVVIRRTDGWAVLVDSDGDGSFGGERPIYDYSRGHETFGWWTGSRPAPTAVAVNLTDTGPDSPPLLDLIFDTSGHGTHVAGIAAGYGLHGVAGFNGVAPGASLLALKVANDARGGITVTGSMVAAVDYAIRYAAARQMPLVVNLSYGVGNEREGRARIDALLDSVLAAHPEVVMTISAGNDGPGLSTLGLPASARRVLSVGATYPGSFLPLQPNGRRFDDQVAFFSSRGGELARPDLVVPGVAYSTVPAWDVGEEIKDGTSMAAPHASGLAALLLSGLKANGRTAEALLIRRALMASARPLPAATAVDQGAGLPDLLRAWGILAAWPRPSAPEVVVQSEPGESGELLEQGPAGLTDTVRTFTVTATGQPAGSLIRLRTSDSWLAAPDTVRLASSVTIPVRYRGLASAGPGVRVGVVEGWGADSVLGPAFRLVSTVVVPRAMPADSVRLTSRVAAGGLARNALQADSGRAFRISVAEPRGAPLLAFLHEPGGMPWRGGAARAVTSPDSAAVFDLDGRDVVGGSYELVLVTGPAYPVEGQILIEPAPVRLDASRQGDTVRVRTASAVTAPVAGAVALSLLGGERGVVTSGRGSADQEIPFTLPDWARRAVIEMRLDRDQWPRFTDFGLTLVDQDGRQLGTSPMNYAVGRLELVLPPGRTTRQARVVLSPGFAEPGSMELWHARLAIRLYAGEPAPVRDSIGVTAAPGQAVESVVVLPRMPWPLGDGFFPLARVSFRRGDRSWSRESGLPNQLPPIMP